jgi:hypothetical protein
MKATNAKIVPDMTHFIAACYTAAMLLTACVRVEAQALDKPTPAIRTLNVQQFGVSRDATYIFCAWLDCPERTEKTLTVQKFALEAVSNLAQLPTDSAFLGSNPQSKKNKSAQ